MNAATEVRNRRVRRHHPAVRRAAVIIAIGAAAMMLAVAVDDVLFANPTFVHRVTVVNETPYDIEVRASRAGGAGTIGLGVARQHCDTPFEQVIDLGPVWELQLHTQGVAADAITVSRSGGTDDNWTVHIPAAVGDDLRAAEVPLPPRLTC